MPSFSGLLILTAVAFGAPFALGLVPRFRLPAVVLEIVAGIVVGPSVLGWVHVDQTIAVVSTLGLAFLLFLAGLEVETTHHQMLEWARKKYGDGHPLTGRFWNNLALLRHDRGDFEAARTRACRGTSNHRADRFDRGLTSAWAP